MIISQGGAFAGWSLYLHEGRPKYCHDLAGLMRFDVEAETAVPAGEHQVRMEFTYDGGGPAKGGTTRTAPFTGKVSWVQLDAGLDDHDHQISPEERLRVATAIQ